MSGGPNKLLSPLQELEVGGHWPLYLLVPHIKNQCSHHYEGEGHGPEWTKK